MKPESAMWKKIRPHLIAAKLDPVRVENPIYPGTPDINLAIGSWIEMKTIEAWRLTGITPIRHFTPQQRVWLYRRWKFAPGTTYLLLEVRALQLWLLFDGDVAAKIVGRVDSTTHHVRARAVLDVSELSKLPALLARRDRVVAGLPGISVRVERQGAA